MIAAALGALLTSIIAIFAGIEMPRVLYIERACGSPILVTYAICIIDTSNHRKCGKFPIDVVSNSVRDNISTPTYIERKLSVWHKYCFCQILARKFVKQIQNTVSILLSCVRSIRSEAASDFESRIVSKIFDSNHDPEWLAA